MSSRDRTQEIIKMGLWDNNVNSLQSVDNETNSIRLVFNSNIEIIPLPCFAITPLHCSTLPQRKTRIAFKFQI